MSNDGMNMNNPTNRLAMGEEGQMSSLRGRELFSYLPAYYEISV